MKLNFLKFIIMLAVGWCVAMSKLPLFSFSTIFRYEAAEAQKPEVNPLKGWTPWISGKEPVVPVSMVFVRMKWSEIEPEEGVYSFEQFEEEHHMKEWREKRVRFVIRIVCDTPGEEKHMDIPQWLYDKTYGDGDWYDSSYGKGYSPNYSNPVFMEKHTKLIQAFAAYYAKDPQLGFVQLGSLGHWGEWHIDSEASIRPFPMASIYETYIRAYLDVIPASKLMMRRPVDLAGEKRMGLYNDSFGQISSHRRWLSWIAEGYYSSQSKEELLGMADFWKFAPSGGEFSASYEETYYVSEGFEETMELLLESHTSFIGPRGGSYIEEMEYNENILTMSREMGYCFQLSDVILRKNRWSKNYLLQIQFDNIGIAPFYENWPLLLVIYDAAGNVVFTKEQDIDLPSLLPGKHQLRIVLQHLGFLKAGMYTIAIGLKDPLNGQPGVAFANETGTKMEYLYKVMEFTIKK